MKRVVQAVLGGVMVVSLTAGVSGAAVAAKAKKVPTAKYAKLVCAAYGGRTDLVAEYIDTYNNDTSTDPVAFQGQTIDLTNELLADLLDLEKKLKKSYPDLDDGKAIGKLFVKGIADTRSEISDALAEFEAADASGVAFTADVSTFELAINLLDVNVSDPFGEVSDQDMLGAFDDERSCDEVVDIFGV